MAKKKKSDPFEALVNVLHMQSSTLLFLALVTAVGKKQLNLPNR